MDVGTGGGGVPLNVLQTPNLNGLKTKDKSIRLTTGKWIIGDHRHMIAM